MTGKNRILTALGGGKPAITPVAIDYMSLYLAERVERAYVAAYRQRLEREGRLRKDPDQDLEIRVQATLQAYDCFQEQHDWFSVWGGPLPERVAQQELILEDGAVFELDHTTGVRRQLLLSGEETKTREMDARFEQARQVYHDRDRLKQVMARQMAGRRAARGDLRPVEAIVRQRGDAQFIYTGAAAPFWAPFDLIGFEGMMTSLHDAPERVFAMLDAHLASTLEYAQAFKDAGGHGVRVEECLASADMISPAMYERFALPYEEKLFGQLRRMGLKTILYFCGDVTPRLPALRGLPIDALMVEESKKTFVIDIGAVREAVGPDLCLLGNIDAYGMVEKATEAGLQAEVERQIRVAGADGAFIVGVGSPLTLNTPPERVVLLIRSARRDTNTTE
ncbi:MAG: uroporphyrinogen decarboxylase family protein [Chloroflexota bacterium]